MWKFLNESSQGTSHKSAGIECQDSSLVSPFPVVGDDVLLLICSDGAGSARKALRGSSLTCQTIIKCATDFFSIGKALSDITPHVICGWLQELRDLLKRDAADTESQFRDFACTLLFAIVGKYGAVFAQIGDGAIVRSNKENFVPVFWPQSGEYQNTTFFVTDDEYLRHIQIETLQEPIHSIALFTDGLQMLALNFAERNVHEPFFAPMFNALKACNDSSDLNVALLQFLNSTNVNNRTDDDKTLVVATRVTNGDEVL